MAAPLITLTTDFGTRSPYVAAMKGVLLGINPHANVLDLSHDIPPQDLRHAAFFLAEAIPCFPSDTIHIVVVDPGVGSTRAILYVCVGGQRLLVPDNGCWTLLAQGLQGPLRVWQVAEPRYWRPTVSPTFHGRDIFAPVAGYVSRGVAPDQLGPRVSTWQQLAWPTPQRGEGWLRGEVIFVDDFGNLISNIPGFTLPVEDSEFFLGSNRVPRRVRTYSDAQPGELVALVSSSGLLEIAVVQGNASQRTGAAVGTRVRVESQP